MRIHNESQREPSGSRVVIDLKTADGNKLVMAPLTERPGVLIQPINQHTHSSVYPAGRVAGTDHGVDSYAGLTELSI